MSVSTTPRVRDPARSRPSAARTAAAVVTTAATTAIAALIANAVIHCDEARNCWYQTSENLVGGKLMNRAGEIETAATMTSGSGRNSSSSQFSVSHKARLMSQAPDAT